MCGQIVGNPCNFLKTYLEVLMRKFVPFFCLFLIFLKVYIKNNYVCTNVDDIMPHEFCKNFRMSTSQIYFMRFYVGLTCSCSIVVFKIRNVRATRIAIASFID